ncbi:MAG: tetratricopeptide repeat protein [Candidatus Ancaeobacter aquaticus]|nr:tetratricopeptide repeat protein [Candidatus Ancaeobacter aquaticus]
MRKTHSMRAAIISFLIVSCTLISSGIAEDAMEIADKCYDQATDYFNNKDYDLAVELYSEAANLDPDYVDAYYGLGMSYVRLKQYKKAFEAFEEALFIDSDHAQSHYGMGIMYPIVMRNNDKAIEHFETYLRLKPRASDRDKVEGWIDNLRRKGKIHRNPEMVEMYNSGVDAFNRGHYDEAEYYYKEALRLNKHYGPAHNALGLVYVRGGRYHDAAKEFETALKINPHNAESHYDLGVVYPVFGDHEKAVFHYTQYIKMKPNAPDIPQVKKWRKKLRNKKKELSARANISSYSNGVAAYGEGKYKQAIKYYKEALDKNPRFEDAWRGLGLSYIQIKKYREALNCFQEALRINPDSFEVHYCLGIVSPLLGDVEGGITHFNKYLALRPDAPDRKKVQEWIASIERNLDVSYYNKGVDFYNQGKYDEALESYLQALELSPDYVDAMRGVGLTLVKQKNYSDALDIFLEAYEIDPDDPEINYCLGVIYPIVKKDTKKGEYHYKRYLELNPEAEDRQMVEEWIESFNKSIYIDYYNQGVELYDRGDYQDAIEKYRKALELNPDYFDAYRGLGLVYIKLKQYDDAFKSFLIAYELSPEDPEVNYCLGVCYPIMGDKDKGAWHYKKYLELSPETPDKEKVEQWIRKLQQK